MNDYFIERVQVEGGFLDGLDLVLQNNLNAIIGARGTGKSTLVELIRFCIGAPGHTIESERRSFSHARTVLQDGQVTLTLSNGISSIRIARNFDDPPPTIPIEVHLPLIFSQTEVETVGLLSSGRLNIIDSFIGKLDLISEKENSAIAKARSFTYEITAIQSEINEYEDKLLKLPSIEQQLRDFEPKEKSIAAISEEAAKKNEMLNHLTKILSEESLEYEYVNNFLNGNHRLVSALEENLSRKPQGLNWKSEKSDVLEKSKQSQNSAIQLIEQGLGLLKNVDMEVDNLLKSISIKKSEVNSNSQKLRAEIENLQAGAGEIVRIGQNLKKEKAQLASLLEVVREKRIRVKTIRDERNTVLDDLENIRFERSEIRMNIAKKLTSILAPRIRVNIEVAGQLDEYLNVLVNALKGSGLKYNDLASAISDSIPPRELIRIIDSNDIDSFTSLVPISKDRASKVIQCLRDVAMDNISTVLLEDEVKFELLDGSEYKDFSLLSTGQRCTVILPIVLEHKDTILIVDQPEDHIDNAFIVDTLISAILRRSGGGQIIVTTHNANVPVLGNAQQVVHFGSDGRRGFVLNIGSLDSAKVVEAISNVMEGGHQAFVRRADFYKNIYT